MVDMGPAMGSILLVGGFEKMFKSGGVVIGFQHTFA